MFSQLILVLSAISFLNANHCNGADRFVDGKCFIIRKELYDFYEAQKFCQHNVTTWSNLGVPTSDIQTNYVTHWAQGELGDQREFWIGVYRKSGSIYFRTLYGEYLRYNNFPIKKLLSDYGAASTSDGKWTTEALNLKLPFICSYDAYR